MAIRRPPTTFSDTISTADIADDAISGGKLANDIAISTTGNIATTGSGTLTVAGASNFGSVASGTLGSSVVFPAGHVIKTYHAVFKGAQSITGQRNAQTAVPDGDYILVGNGASGAAGAPLSITCDAPASSSSKYLITGTVTASNIDSGQMALKFFYNNSGVGSETSLPDFNSGASGVQSASHFGASHNSSGGSAYSTRQLGGSYLWSPSSSLAQTISFKAANYTANTLRINRPDHDGNSSYVLKSISTLVIQEIA